MQLLLHSPGMMLQAPYTETVYVEQRSRQRAVRFQIDLLLQIQSALMVLQQCQAILLHMSTH